MLPVTNTGRDILFLTEFSGLAYSSTFTRNPSEFSGLAGLAILEKYDVIVI